MSNIKSLYTNKFIKSVGRFFMKPDQLLEKVNSFVWGPILLTFLLGTGMYFMIRLHFLPLRRLGMALKLAVGCNRNQKEGGEMQGSVSPFSSFMTELAATIGTGNIVGVATAMSLGGPGALFWMMVSAFIGMATKLVETTLSVSYRKKNDKGDLVGGPMYVMKYGMNQKKVGQYFAGIYSLFAVFAAFGMGNMVQSNSIADTLSVSFGVDKVITGMLVSAMVAVVVIGGIKTIGKLANFLVPVMGILYLAGVLIVILVHWKRIPTALLEIVMSALCPKAIAGGTFGVTTISMLQAFRWGISRGVFSNEAGLGASGITAATANTKDPVRQGYISMTGVFFDTVVICAATGLALVVSGVQNDNFTQMEGSLLTLMAFEKVFGKKGQYITGISMVLFAFATIMAWAYQGERAFEFLNNKSFEKRKQLFRICYVAAAFAGAVIPLKSVWTLADIFNGLMAFPNLLCLMSLSDIACEKIVMWDRGGKKSQTRH